MSITIATMEGVREYGEGYPVELAMREEEMRMVLVAFSDGGCNRIEIDLMDLVEWMQSGNLKTYSS